MKTVATTIGRILFALPFILFAFGHFTNVQAMAAMVPLAFGSFWVILTGVALLAAGVSIIIRVKAPLASLLLAIMLILFVIMIDVPNALSTDPALQMMGQAMAMKDVALAGGALYLSGTLKA